MAEVIDEADILQDHPEVVKPEDIAHVHEHADDGPTMGEIASIAARAGGPMAELGLGAVDAAKAMALGLVKKGAGTVEGLMGAARGVRDKLNGDYIPPRDTYMGAKEAYDKGPTIIAQNAEPATDQGKDILNGIGKAMRYTGVPQAAGWIDDTVKQTLGPEAADLLGTVVELGTLRAPELKLKSPRMPKTAGANPQLDAVADMKNAGYLVSSHVPTGPEGATAGPTAMRLADAAAGDAADAARSVVNQDKTNFFAARQGRLPTQYVTPKALKATIDVAEQGYADLKQAAIDVHPDIPFVQEVASWTSNPLNASESAVKGSAAIRKLQKELLTIGQAGYSKGAGYIAPTTEGIVDRVMQLRSDGFRGLASNDVAAQDLGSLQLRAADALDDLMGRRINQLASYGRTPMEQALLRKLYSNYLDSRAWRSDLHVIEASMNDTTGQISAAKINQIGQKRNLQGTFNIIKRAYDTNPTAMQDVARASLNVAPEVGPGVMAGSNMARASGLGNVVKRMLAKGIVTAEKRAQRPTGKVKIARQLATRAGTIDALAEQEQQ